MWQYVLELWSFLRLSNILLSSRCYLDGQAGFRKGRDQIANIRWIMEKAREFQKNISFCFIDYAKVFDCVDHDKPWKALRETGISDHLTCLLINLYVGQEATVRVLCGRILIRW